MAGFIEGLDRQQTMLLHEHLDDYVEERLIYRLGCADFGANVL